MSDPRRFSELDLERAARGKPVRRSARPGIQRSPDPVTLAGTLHLSFVAPEAEGRKRFLAAQEALIRAGFSATLEGPRVAIDGPRRAR